ncbi:MAG: glutamate racemase [Anaerolineae bacterium]|nr:glutamate racemase [Anaerolineae bacterium]
MTEARFSFNRSPESPIGIFDSGVGGLSVWREIARQLPHESTLYVADQEHVPYGTRSLAEVREYAKGITRFLLAQGAKIIVIACNTASGAALRTLRESFPDLAFVGMEPAVKPAAENTHSGVIAVIATQATFQGELFHSLVERFAAGVRLETQICPGLVELVERGELDTPETEATLHSCLNPLLQAGADHLVLGCTHYPFLAETITRITGPNVTLVDPAPAVARQTARVLTHQNLCAPASIEAKHTFFTSGSPEALKKLAHRLVGFEGAIQSIVWRGNDLQIIKGEDYVK